MVIKVFFAVLVLCTAAVVAVVLAIHLRVKRHLNEVPVSGSNPAVRPDKAQESAAEAANEVAAGDGDVPIRVPPSGVIPAMTRKSSSV